MPGFVDRTAELSRLRELYRSDAAELAVVYGRRRLGKTELVSQSLAGRADAVVYQARQKTRSLQIEQFLDRAAEPYPTVSQLRADWEPILQHLGERDAVVVLDEFPYLVAEDESLPSVLQALFDREFDDATPTFVLIGSSISMMEEAALMGSSPLYGRSSLKLDVRELPFGAATEFYGDTTPTESVFLWGVFGGVPYYLERLDPAASLAANVHDTVLSTHGTLHDEPDYVLRMELREPTRYFSILEAIAGGDTSRNGIAGATGIEYSSLSTYLSRLERLRLIERTVSGDGAAGAVEAGPIPPAGQLLQVLVPVRLRRERPGRRPGSGGVRDADPAGAPGLRRPRVRAAVSRGAPRAVPGADSHGDGAVVVR